MGQVQTRSYRDGKLDDEGFPLADVSEHLSRKGTVIWVDIYGPDRSDIDLLAGELGLHELAVEDALEPHQRPKLDHYPTHEFLSCHAVRVDPDATESATAIEKSEVDAFIGDRWLVTVRDAEGFFDMDKVLQRWEATADLAVHGVGYLLYGLLDTVVDGYFEVVQTLDDFYDEISERIFEEKPLDQAQQQRWFQMRRALVRFHRLGAPLREAVSSLMRREQGLIDDDMRPYYEDVYDHVLRVSDATDSLRDLVGTIVETNLSLRDYRQNEIVKKVSGWAAIVAVPALLTGYFGMNVPYPGDGQPSGFWFSTALIVVVTLTLYGVFRSRDWL
jgi:magnesium transporter